MPAVSIGSARSSSMAAMAPSWRDVTATPGKNISRLISRGVDGRGHLRVNRANYQAKALSASMAAMAPSWRDVTATPGKNISRLISRGVDGRGHLRVNRANYQAKG